MHYQIHYQIQQRQFNESQVAFILIKCHFISTSHHPSESIMDNEVVLFLVSASVLILYLIFSAFTEMGTKLPWKK
ncbi:hypothetical protein SD80_032580 [Scytonema tolypothrichoides VB-61278]|nr:hypothetical protein SD80_032580 [Scytonema tolypothrichoides VB-61278]